jgi:hypothetical protein
MGDLLPICGSFHPMKIFKMSSLTRISPIKLRQLYAAGFDTFEYK